MDLQRAAGKFSSSPIEVWDSSSEDWLPTDLCGSLQVFDRFITERSFGQKKRIMTIPAGNKLDEEYAVIRLEGSEEAFLVEKFNEDVRFGEVYAYSYMLHEAPFFVGVYKTSVDETNAAGVNIGGGGEVLIESVWADLSRFGGVPSKNFDESEITIINMTFPRDSLVDSDCYLKTPEGDRYNVDEVYFNLDLVAAKGKRIGV